MTDRRVRPLSTDDAAAAGAVLSASHHNYPAFRVEFPDPRVRHRVLLPFQTAAARDGAVYGGLLGAYLDNDLVGVALWQPPGRFPLSALRKARMTPALLRVVLAAPRTFPLFARSGAALERAFPEEPVWYLQAPRHPSERPAPRRRRSTACRRTRHCRCRPCRLPPAHLRQGQHGVLQAVGFRAHPAWLSRWPRRAHLLRDDPARGVRRKCPAKLYEIADSLSAGRRSSPNAEQHEQSAAAVLKAI
jgi:hypothetical protein